MTAFYLTLLAVLISGLGGRDQAVIAGLTARQGARPAVLVIGILASLATAAFAAWAASAVAPILAPRARLVLAAMALALAGAEALVLPAPRRPAEPTASLGALAAVVTVFQMLDAARFLIFAIAIAANAPIPAALGGGLGGAGLITLAWLTPVSVDDRRLRAVRRMIGAALSVAAGLLALLAFDRV